MSILRRLFSNDDPRDALRPLYSAIVSRGREPHWYAQGGVADTLDGRFDMITAILCLVLLRLESVPEAKQQSVWLTELFVDDMDGQLRQIGIGDMIVGKHIGRMMSALGGRLSAYRSGLGAGESLEDALIRNVYRGNAPAPDQLEHVAAGLRTLWNALAQTGAAPLWAGNLP